MSNNVFRKVSLERLSSPEQLDKLLTITSPRGWITLSTVIIIIVLAIIWGFLGSIPVKVDTSGLLISSGGTVTISAVTNGIVTDIRVKNGDDLKKGDTIAIMGENSLSTEIEDIKEIITVLGSIQPNSNWGSLTIPSELGDLQDLGLQIQSQTAALANDERNPTLALKEYQNYKKLYDAAAVSKTDLDIKYDAYVSAQDAYDQAGLQLRQSTAKFQALQQTRLKEYNERLTAKQNALLNDYLIVAPEDGKVMNVKVEKGKVITAGTEIATVSRTGANVKALEAVIYVPVSDGKKLKEGMGVKIYPSTVAREEYGYMRGTVSEVPQYPVTRESVMETLGNEALVETLTGQGAPLEVRVDLVSDSSTVSGFAWSTKKGAGLNVENGTLCSASVVVDAQRPVSMVIPLLKKHYLPIE